MADAPPERLRLFLDATVLIKAVSFPRLPFEIVRLGLHGEVRIALSSLVVESAWTHVARLYPAQVPLLKRVLEQLDYTEIPAPSAERVRANRDLCRDESDIPIVLAAIDARVDYLVTTDRDLTVEDATTMRLRGSVNPITPLALLRHVLKWPEERIEAAIHRNWQDLSTEDWAELYEN